MFNSDSWQEIFITIRKNKLRTFLTGFSVAWGIFMLIILLGSGTGIQNGVEQSFNDDATNSIWVSAYKTSIPYKGLQPGRRINLTNEDYDRTKRTLESGENFAARYSIWGALVNYQNQYGNYSVRGTHPGHQFIENTIIVQGRFINETDVNERRKVIVISEMTERELFKSNGEAIGKYMNVKGIPFKVVGIFTDEGAESEMRQMYIPISSAQTVFFGGQNINNIMFTIGDASLEQSQQIAQDIREELARVHHFHPKDQRAIFVRNMMENFQKINEMLGNIRIFIWLIGIGTILAGIVGVSNIMLIVVKERTKEIGIKKAIGATPAQIVGQIILEAIFITSVAGYIGLTIGVFVLELMSKHVNGIEFFKNPQVDFSVAISATAVLIVAGISAGLFPATKAAKINPVAALREE